MPWGARCVGGAHPMALQLSLLCASPSIALGVSPQAGPLFLLQERLRGGTLPQGLCSRRWFLAHRGCDLAPSVPGPGLREFTGARGWAEASGLS